MIEANIFLPSATRISRLVGSSSAIKASYTLIPLRSRILPIAHPNAVPNSAPGIFAMMPPRVAPAAAPIGA